MKKLILLIVILSVITSCKKSEDNSEKNIAIVEQYIQAVENLNTEGMDKILAEDYIGYGPNYGSTINKEDALKNWKNFSTNLYKSIDYEKSRNIAVSITEGENMGEWVTNWAELTIVYKKDNAEVKLWANTLYQIDNDKIVKTYTIYNEADALNQLGYIFINNN
jgi:hypothetical protein